jgi:hypothetical protein
MEVSSTILGPRNLMEISDRLKAPAALVPEKEFSVSTGYQAAWAPTFRKLDVLPSSGDGRETHTLLGPLEMVKLKSSLHKHLISG